MVRGPKRAERWSHVLRDVAIGHSATTSIKLVLSNVRAWPCELLHAQRSDTHTHTHTPTPTRTRTYQHTTFLLSVFVLCITVAHDGKESLGPWLQEEKDAVLRWRDEHTGSDGKVDVCFV